MLRFAGVAPEAVAPAIWPMRQRADSIQVNAASARTVANSANRPGFVSTIKLVDGGRLAVGRESANFSSRSSAEGVIHCNGGRVARCPSSRIPASPRGNRVFLHSERRKPMVFPNSPAFGHSSGAPTVASASSRSVGLEDNVKGIERTLTRDLPNQYVEELDWSVYADNVVFADPLTLLQVSGGKGGQVSVGWKSSSENFTYPQFQAEADNCLRWSHHTYRNCYIVYNNWSTPSDLCA